MTPEQAADAYADTAARAYAAYIDAAARASYIDAASARDAARAAADAAYADAAARAAADAVLIDTAADAASARDAARSAYADAYAAYIDAADAADAAARADLITQQFSDFLKRWLGDWAKGFLPTFSIFGLIWLISPVPFGLNAVFLLSTLAGISYAFYKTR